MNLVEKVKNMGKNSILAGALASPLYINGCVAIIEGLARVEAAEIEASAIGDTARAGPNGKYVNYFNVFFAANNLKGDINRNGVFDDHEFEGIKDEFKDSESIFFCGRIYNRRGAILNVKLLDPQNKNIFEEQYLIKVGPISNAFSFKPFDLRPGSYTTIWEIGSQVIGVKQITVKDTTIVKNGID